MINLSSNHLDVNKGAKKTGKSGQFSSFEAYKIHLGILVSFLLLHFSLKE